MANTTTRPLLLEQAAAWCAAKLKAYKVPAIAGVIFGLLAYMFAFTNKLVNHDEVYTLFRKGGTFASGRWGLKILELVFPNYSMPWVYGIVTIVLITVSVCIMVSIFSIRSKLLQVLLAGSVITFPSLIGTFTYMFTSSSYAVSFLMAVLAVWLLTRLDKRTVIPAIICMISSLSIYQSYVAIAASLLVLSLIQRLLKEDDITDVIKCGIFFVLFLAVSLGCYYIATMVINKLVGSGFNSYASGNLSFSFADIPQRALLSYQNFFKFFTGFRGLMPTDFSRLLHKLCLILIAVLFALWGISRKQLQFGRILWLIVLIGILPFAINCMYLFTTEDSVHTLVLYGFVAVYVLAAVIADFCMDLIPEGTLQKLSLNALSVVLALIIAGSTYIANESFLLLHLRYENAYAFYTSLIADVKMTPEFDENTKLAVIGTFREPEFYLQKFPFSDHLTGTDGFLPDVYSKNRFLEYYIGFPIPMASDQEIAAITATEEYNAMAVYPYYGSMQMFDDILVVKLS